MAARIAPAALLAAVARLADPTVRAVAISAPTSWRNDAAPYAVVRPVSPHAPALRGDGRTLEADTLVQLDLWETPGTTDDARLVALEDAIDGQATDTGHVGHLEGTLLVPEPDTDELHHALTIRYRLPQAG